MEGWGTKIKGEDLRTLCEEVKKIGRLQVLGIQLKDGALCGEQKSEQGLEQHSVQTVQMRTAPGGRGIFSTG